MISARDLCMTEGHDFGIAYSSSGPYGAECQRCGVIFEFGSGDLT